MVSAHKPENSSLRRSKEWSQLTRRQRSTTGRGITGWRDRTCTSKGSIRMLDNRFVTAHDWALASDGMQWILLHNHRQDGTGRWQAVSFVHSSRDILARCMREKGCPTEDARDLLKGLPLTFNEWWLAASQRASTGGELGSDPLPKTLAARSAVQPDVRRRRTQAIKKGNVRCPKGRTKQPAAPPGCS
jgi:hypothetical protein